jgi:tetratricopeptide (TPR) repeat protein
MRFLLAWLSAATLIAAAPAHAAWNVAKSRHFVIYSNESPKGLHEFAATLERFDQGVRVATNMTDPEVGDGNRLTVFVLPNTADVRALVGDKTGSLAGFYTGRVAGSLAFVGKANAGSEGIDTQTVFFHEYTHHLMMQDLDRPYPEWYIEGFAEFFSTPKFDKDGSVWFGLPAQYRAWGLFNGPQITIESLMQGMPSGMDRARRDVFYGRAWLLSHYLLMETRRQGQLARYIAALSSGTSSLDAAKQTFGDLNQLNKELNQYLGQRLFEFKVGASRIKISSIDVQPLSPGAAQVILARARIKYKPADAEALAPQIREIEARYAGDELVESTLAEAELDTNHVAAAEAAADRALKANPRNTEAIVLKGRAMAERAAGLEGPARPALFEQARQQLISANKFDTEDPEPLYEFYKTFLKEGVRPTDNALAALHYASDLAPQDLGVRMNSAIAYLNEGRPKEARATLIVVAYSPHAEGIGQAAQRLIAAIDEGKGKAALFELRNSTSPQQGSH